MGEHEILEQTGDAAKAQGWSPFVLDTTATADATTMSSQPAVDPAKESASFGSGPYAVMPHPTDGRLVYGGVSRPAGIPALHRRRIVRGLQRADAGSASAAATSTRMACMGLASSGHLVSSTAQVQGR